MMTTALHYARQYSSILAMPELRLFPPRLYWERIHLLHLVIPCVTPHLSAPCYVGALT